MTGALVPGREPAQHLVEAALAAAARLGSSGSASIAGCAVLVEETSTVNLRWALNGLTTNGLTSARSVTVVVGAGVSGGTGVGVLSRQGVDLAGIDELVAEAVLLAIRATPAEDAAEFVTGSAAEDWHDPAAETGAAALAGVAEALGEVVGRSLRDGRESFGFALHEMTTTWLGTSGGLRYRHQQPRGTIELTGKAGARARSAWVGQATRDFHEVDVLAMDDQIAARLRWQERTITLPPGRYDTVLPPSAVADLLVYYFWSSDARSAYEGRSVFSKPGGGVGQTRLGERLTGTPLTLFSDPHRPGLECADRVLTGESSPMASVFDNGLPSPAAIWLDNGTIAALPSTRHTAGLTGLPVVPVAENLVLEAGGGSGGTLDLVAGTDRGLLLTSLWYIREVDPQTLLLTGLTRDGVYVIEDGEVIGAAGNYRFNESPVDLLGRVQAAGATEVTLGREWGEWFTRTAMPALRVEGYNMSTASEAS
jgi:predicted Zn-dependent protease